MTNPITIDDQQMVDIAERLMDRCAWGRPLASIVRATRGASRLCDLITLASCATRYEPAPCGSSHGLLRLATTKSSLRAVWKMAKSRTTLDEHIYHRWRRD